MLKSLIIVIACFNSLLCENSFAQQNRDITYIGYPGFYLPPGHTNSEYLTFDTLQRIAKQYPKELDGSVYEFYIMFKIDTFANVIERTKGGSLS